MIMKRAFMGLGYYYIVRRDRDIGREFHLDHSRRLNYTHKTIRNFNNASFIFYNDLTVTIATRNFFFFLLYL